VDIIQRIHILFTVFTENVVDLLNRSINGNIKRKNLIDVICAVDELVENLPIRFGEEDILKKLAEELNVRFHKQPGASHAIDYCDPNVKALILVNVRFFFEE
jgi:regulator of sigma D